MPIAVNMTTEAPKPKEVHTTLNYFRDNGKPPVPMHIGGPEKPVPQPKIPHPVVITDVTGNVDDFKLEKHGFQYFKHKTSFASFEDEEAIRREYYPEIDDLVWKVTTENKNFPNPSYIRVMSHITRRGPADASDQTPEGKGQGPVPLHGVHCDQSVNAVPGIIQRWLGESAEELKLMKSPRFQIFNIWRPIRTVTRDPLAVGDARSFPKSDLVIVPLIFYDHATEAIEVKPPPPDRTHKWYYKHEQQPDDVLIFMQMDSKEHVMTPHCAFKDPSVSGGMGEPRMSIEVRVLVFYDTIEPTGKEVANGEKPYVFKLSDRIVKNPY